ncbi:MAG: crossover junction endodeoxyribonuclease RuvC, partial [Gammaproteobacteria bacterium]|nr:crossover junction endodeoxyribonuclease RuvC [Gammaproteobacteria bacterium]
AVFANHAIVRPELAEYSPREIKQAVAGYGAADKQQVQIMVRRLLALSGDIQADAADALAVALCHANSRRTAALLAGHREAVR